MLLLLSDNDDLRQRLEAEAAERKKETAELRDRLEKETGDLKEKLNNEMTALDYYDPKLLTKLEAIKELKLKLEAED